MHALIVAVTKKSKPLLKYELWSGKKMVGYYETSRVLAGKAVHFYDWEKRTGFDVPIAIVYKTNPDQVSWTGKMVLNVSRKSKRQIEMITGFQPVEKVTLKEK